MTEVAVNVSPQQVMGPSFTHTVASALAETGIDPHPLCLEVTESLFLHGTERACAVMASVNDMGVQLSLEDFGTGYSSLSYVQNCPVDVVKIDRSFTAELAQDRSTRSIVPAVIDLSHALDMVVIAEGVETLNDLHQVAALGADYAQCFHVSQPIDNHRIHHYADTA